MACQRNDTAAVEEWKASVGYALFAFAFVALYVVVVCVSVRQTVIRLYRRTSFDSNNSQVAVLVGVGSVARATYFAVQFLSAAWVRDLLLAVAQISWVSAFALIVFFWMEMQLTVRRIASVSRYKRQLVFTTAGYTVVRLLQSLLRAVDDGSSTLDAVQLVLTGLLYLFYVALFGFAAFWSIRLWRRMVRIMKQVHRRHSDSQLVQAKLRKLTIVVFTETAVAFLFFAYGAVRYVVRLQDEDMRCDDPSRYILIALPHYLFEYVLILILAFSVVVSDSKPVSSSSPSPASTPAAAAPASAVAARMPQQHGRPARGSAVVAMTSPLYNHPLSTKGARLMGDGGGSNGGGGGGGGASGGGSHGGGSNGGGGGSGSGSNGGGGGPRGASTTAAATGAPAQATSAAATQDVRVDVS